HPAFFVEGVLVLPEEHNPLPRRALLAPPPALRLEVSSWTLILHFPPVNTTQHHKSPEKLPHKPRWPSNGQKTDATKTATSVASVRSCGVDPAVLRRERLEAGGAEVGGPGGVDRADGDHDPDGLLRRE